MFKGLPFGNDEYNIFSKFDFLAVFITHWLLVDLNEIYISDFQSNFDNWWLRVSLMWLSLDLTDDKSAMVVVMALCRQATHLSPCWPSSNSPHDVTRLQRTNQPPESSENLYILHWHHNGPRWRLKSPASPILTQLFIRAQIKEDIKAPRHWPLCGEFTGDRWIPRTNGQ